MNKDIILQSLDYRAFYKSLIPSLKENGKAETVGLCPFHDDHNPSLSVNLSNGLYNCFACGAKGDVFTFYEKLKGVDFKTALQEIARMQGITDATIKQKVVATFKYQDTEGKTLYIKERIEPGRDGRSKEFRFKHKEGEKWVNGRGYDPVLYNLKEVSKSKEVIIVEGEEKADLLMSWGLVATCLDSGANSPWRDEYLNVFQGGCRIIFLPDNDPPGRSYALKIAESLHKSEMFWVIKIVELPGLQEAEDIVDWAKIEGNTKEKLLEIIKTSSEWKPLETQKGGIRDWPDPIPLDACSLLPPFPTEALPPIGKEIVETVAEVTQVDPGLPGSIFLSVLSACLMKKAEVDLGTHKEPLCLYTAPILPSGERKSQTMGILTKPLYDWQNERQKEISHSIKEVMTTHKLKNEQLSKLRKQVAREEDDPVKRVEYEKEVRKLTNDMDSNPIPKSPTYIVDDITTEALGIFMTDNREKMSVFSTEGGIFGIIAGRYNDKGGSLDLYLKAHAGDPWSCHRVGRGTNTMQRPALTMCLTVQPDVLEEIGGNSLFRGRGLLARYLYCYCKPMAGYRERQKKAIPEALSNKYRDHVSKLMNIPEEERILKLTPDAQALWDEFYNDVEQEMREGGALEYLKDWGSKLPGVVARIAGLLHFAEHGDKAGNIPSSVNIVRVSCVIGAYYKEHAVATFKAMREHPGIKSANAILSHIRRHNPRNFKGRDIMRHTNLETMDEVLQGLGILIERGYIRSVEAGYSGIGRPEATIYEVNPKIN